MGKSFHIPCSFLAALIALYFFAAKGDYDAVVSPYHDQGLVALKLLHFEDGINITLGLPIIRTSVDHGTAFNIAWQSKANPKSMISAIKIASEISANLKSLDLRTE